jgi:hypothetical protein
LEREASANVEALLTLAPREVNIEADWMRMMRLIMFVHSCRLVLAIPEAAIASEEEKDSG